VAGSTPVPLKLIVWGLLLALSAMETAALRAPVAVGVNVILIVQLACAETLAGQLVVPAKSPLFVPVRVMLPMVRVAVPVLVSSALSGGLVIPKSSGANESLLGERPTAGAGGGGGGLTPPTPPPQAPHTPITSSVVANHKAAGRRRIADEPNNMAKASDPAANQSRAPLLSGGGG